MTALTSTADSTVAGFALQEVAAPAPHGPVNRDGDGVQAHGAPLLLRTGP